VVGEGVPQRRRIPALTGARGRILDEFTVQSTFDSAGERPHGIAYLPCDPASTWRLACEHRPSQLRLPDGSAR
jgi:hypothetical protein